MGSPELPAAGPAPDPGRNRLAESAKGWHGIQLGVLGFTGLCGVLATVGDQPGPRWLQWLAAALVVLSLVLNGIAIFQVGRVAYPFLGAATGQLPAADTGSRRLRNGIRTTFLGVAVLAIGNMAGWWPEATGADAGAGADTAADAGAGAVEVRDAYGRGWCGELVDGPAGSVRLDTATGQVAIPLDGIVTLRPVTDCDND